MPTASRHCGAIRRRFTGALMPCSSPGYPVPMLAYPEVILGLDFAAPLIDYPVVNEPRDFPVALPIDSHTRRDSDHPVAIVQDVPLNPQPAGQPMRRGHTPYLASFDGGCRPSSNHSAYGWCVWSPSGQLLQWGAQAFTPALTNNVMEAQGLLHCLAWFHSQRISQPLLVAGDSQIIINQALMLHKCRAPHLRQWIARIRAHGCPHAPIRLDHVRREHNQAADALCNWAMDTHTVLRTTPGGGVLWPCPLLHPIPLPPGPIWNATDQHPAENDSAAFHKAQWQLVMDEIGAMGHLISGHTMAHRVRPTAPPPRARKPIPPVVHTSARALSSPFDSVSHRSCTVRGRLRYVPRRVFDNIARLADAFAIPFPVYTAFLAPGPGPLTVPTTDLRILDAIVALPHFGIAHTLELFRGQSADDYRPNKALWPQRYRSHLPTYPDLDLLCDIANVGLVPTWVNPASRFGPRPIPENYVGADRGSAVAIHKLLADYFKGRCIIASLATLVVDPGFHSSAFALVPKQDLPLTVDGRIIHDLSAPVGASVNDLTLSSASPDAVWDAPPTIAARVRDLARRFPGHPVYALGADIADAFHHVPVHSRHASAFGGKLPRTDIGLVSGMAVFGWTASPGFFAVFGKASRHYQRTGASYVLGDSEPFWIFQWVDDIVLVEVDIGDRLQEAEKRLRDGIKLVFGPDGWHEGKFTTWSRQFHAVGIDWDIDNETITIPQRKIDKVRRMVSETLMMHFVPTKRLESVVGVLRHIITFIPITKPFIQRLTAVQMNCKRRHGTGVTMTTFLKKDLEWWRDLTYQNEFAGMPMRLFEPGSTTDDCWAIDATDAAITITSMRLNRRATFCHPGHSQGEALANALARGVEEWGQTLTTTDAWRSIMIHSSARWIVKLVSRMNCDTEKDQALLRECALQQAQYRLRFTTHKLARSMGANDNKRRERIAATTAQLKRAAISESTLGLYNRNFSYWEQFCKDFSFPVWIDELPRAQQARMVGLYAGLCASEGHNKSKTGNKYQTFDGKMAAVVFAHKAIRNAKLDYHDPEYELVAQGYKRTNSQVDRKQPVTTPMLLKMRERLVRPDAEERLLWGSIVLGFFFLDRSSELWGPVVPDKSTGTERAHCVKAHNVILRDQQGRPMQPDDNKPHSVEILFESHKGDRIGQGVTIRHYSAQHKDLCPVTAGHDCLRVRSQWIRDGRKLGPYLTSISTSATIKKAAVAQRIKDAARDMGLDPKHYSPHSLRIGGACALLAAGKSDLVIRLMGRWSSWCFSVYTRLRPGMLRDAASCMIKASTWECHEPRPEPQGGIAIEANSH